MMPDKGRWIPVTDYYYHTDNDLAQESPVVYFHQRYHFMYPAKSDYTERNFPTRKN